MEAVLAALAGIVGWSWKRNEDTRDKVIANTERISGVEENVTYIRGRVDDLYNHLVAGRGPKA